MRTRGIVVVLLLPLLAGCIAIPYKGDQWVVAPIDQAQVRGDAKEKIGPDDSVRVQYKKSGRVDEFTVVELNKDGFIGIAWDRKRYRVSYDQASHLWVERSRWKFAKFCLKFAC